VSEETRSPDAAEQRIPDDMMPGRNGGLLKRGNPGPHSGSGRPPNIIREGLRKNLLASAARMRQRVRDIESLIEKRKAKHGEDYAKLLDDQERLFNAEKTHAEFCAKYGLGMTFTETTRDGNDIPRPVIYLPSNGRGNNDN
jgi:hypothetical protein